MIKLGLYFQTLRHLKFTQILNRLSRKVIRPKRQHIGLCHIRATSSKWSPMPIYEKKMLASDELLLLNRLVKLRCAADWNAPDLPKLVLYNLHYFDDLLAEGGETREAWHVELINRWILENPWGTGNGWEPYPISLRVVNWIKWGLSSNSVSELMKRSLLEQVDFLAQTLEFHLLGNHLFSNAKALIFAGTFFDGERADQWLLQGLDIMDAQLSEQILADGANFELSPMYHDIMLVDVMDMLNLAKSSGLSQLLERKARWKTIAEKMLRWHSTMRHPNEDISRFNDVAAGVAPSAKKIAQYASLLGLKADCQPDDYRGHGLRLWHHDESGYIRLESEAAVALLDCAKVGPDYIPGHAHADSLSFELSVFGMPIFVNSGTSTYEMSELRTYQRGTSAHNTVEVDGRNSSAVWSSFRVAERARPKELAIQLGDGFISAACGHDGYSSLVRKMMHRRTWTMKSEKLIVKDELIGSYSVATARFFLHPDISISKISDSQNEIHLLCEDGATLRLTVEGGKVQVSDTAFYPEFGVAKPSSVISLFFEAPLVNTQLEW